jgi:nicotinamidase-related amidase
MLNVENTVLVVIDVQGNLAQLMHEKDLLFENVQKIIKGAQILAIPMVVTEQNPRGLGPTVPEIAYLLADIEPIDKMSFSCCGSARFMEELRATSRKQVLIAGIEAHVCVYQTTMELLHLGYEVQIVADAISSRVASNKEIALGKMSAGGAALTSTEMALFELLRTAESGKFKEILRIVK